MMGKMLIGDKRLKITYAQWGGLEKVSAKTTGKNADGVNVIPRWES